MDAANNDTPIICFRPYISDKKPANTRLTAKAIVAADWLKLETAGDR